MLIANRIDMSAGTEVQVDSSLIGKVGMFRRKAMPSKIVIDWSNNEMSAKEYADYMVRGNAPMGRCVGAHLYIDHLGQIFQYADLGVYRARRHPPVDESAIWIVMQNKGEPPFDPRVPRGVYRYIFGKKEGPSLCCTSDQVDSLMDVIDLICRSMSIPMGIPRTKAMDNVRGTIARHGTIASAPNGHCAPFARDHCHGHCARAQKGLSIAARANTRGGQQQ